MKNETNLIKALCSSCSYFSVSMIALYSLTNFIFHILPIFEKHSVFGLITITFSYFLSALVFIPLTFMYCGVFISIVYYCILEKNMKLEKHILIFLMLGSTTLIPHVVISFTKQYGVRIEEYYLFYIITWFSAYKSSVNFYEKLKSIKIHTKFNTLLTKKLEKNNFF